MSTVAHIEITRASTNQHYLDATALILEYARGLTFDLSFQNFDKEMASLPDMYSSTAGGLFVAYLDREPVGVIGLRMFEKNEGEVKRMFVKETARRHGIGQRLLRTCIDTARALGYESLKLDTTAFMTAAIKLYTDNGFVEVSAYRYNPQEGARYFELKLKEYT